MAQRLYSNLIKERKRNKYIGITRSVRARIQYLGYMMKNENARSETFQNVPDSRADVPGRVARHFRTIKSACLGCAKPVHLVRMGDGTYEWQHDGIPTAEMMERHRERGIGRQPVCTGRALEMIAKAGEEDHE